MQNVTAFSLVCCLMLLVIGQAECRSKGGQFGGSLSECPEHMQEDTCVDFPDAVCVMMCFKFDGRVCEEYGYYFYDEDSGTLVLYDSCVDK